MLYNTGRRLPGPKGLRRMAERLGLDPQSLMQICRDTVERRNRQEVA